MGYDGYIEIGGQELVNLSRTAQLAGVLGISALWTTPESVQWIQDSLGGDDYDDITEAPWYDAGYPASGEFAGIVPLAFSGLDDSTRVSEITEYVTDGGATSRPRNGTLSIVASVVILASTDSGAEYGKRWLDQRLRGNASAGSCSGEPLRYFRYNETGAPLAHRRDVRTTRGTSITRKAKADCSVLWFAQFTLTCGDPFEYGELYSFITELSNSAAEGDHVIANGSAALVEGGPSAYDHTPIYDPLYPALVPSPSVPQFYPEGWGFSGGASFSRYWATIDGVSPTSLPAVPKITLQSSTDVRSVRVSIWPASENPSTASPQDALFSAAVTYVPGGIGIVVDGEDQSSYAASDATRRADSLVFSPDAKPVDWTSFDTTGGLLVAIDYFDGFGDLSMALALASKSD